MMGEHPFHIAGRKYVDAVRLAGALPLIAPPFEAQDLDALLDAVDGVFLTGSPSNVHPSHYGEAVHDTTLPLDPERDAWTLPLIRQTLARGIPLLAICRGTQETNVALGGSLHQAVQEVHGHNDHRVLHSFCLNTLSRRLSADITCRDCWCNCRRWACTFRRGTRSSLYKQLLVFCHIFLMKLLKINCSILLVTFYN